MPTADNIINIRGDEPSRQMFQLIGKKRGDAVLTSFIPFIYYKTLVQKSKYQTRISVNVTSLYPGFLNSKRGKALEKIFAQGYTKIYKSGLVFSILKKYKLPKRILLNRSAKIKTNNR